MMIIPTLIVASLVLWAIIFRQKTVDSSYKRKRLSIAFIVFLLSWIILTIPGLLLIDILIHNLEKNAVWAIMISLFASIAIAVWASKRMIKS
jgi:hypothetical protein